MNKITEKNKALAEKIAALKKEKTQQGGKAPMESQAIQVLVEITSGILVGASIGYILDEIFDFKFICLLVFTIFGGVAGLINTMRYLEKNKQDKEED
jgi:F0F1-type ATP synthase assembly protein I